MTSLLLGVIGLGGLAFIFLTTEPTLGPRWLFFFFLTLAGSGIALPVVYLIHRRTARQYVSAKVIVAKHHVWGFPVCWPAANWTIASNLIAIILAGGLVFLEIFLRMAEKATFKPDEYEDE